MKLIWERGESFFVSALPFRNDVLVMFPSSDTVNRRTGAAKPCGEFVLVDLWMIENPENVRPTQHNPIARRGVPMALSVLRSKLRKLYTSYDATDPGHSDPVLHG